MRIKTSIFSQMKRNLIELTRQKTSLALMPWTRKEQSHLVINTWRLI